MNKNEIIKNGTSVAIRCEDGVTRFFPVVTVRAMALQKVLGIENK